MLKRAYQIIVRDLKNTSECTIGKRPPFLLCPLLRRIRVKLRPNHCMPIRKGDVEGVLAPAIELLLISNRSRETIEEDADINYLKSFLFAYMYGQAGRLALKTTLLYCFTRLVCQFQRVVCGSKFLFHEWSNPVTHHGRHRTGRLGYCAFTWCHGVCVESVNGRPYCGGNEQKFNALGTHTQSNYAVN
jgi:hypothetical protein